MTEQKAPSNKSEWQQHWRLAGTSQLGTALGVMHLFSLGVLIEPVSVAQGWSRASVASGLTIVAFFSIISASLVGRLIDKVGPRRVAIPGVIAYSMAFALLGFTTPSVWHWWAGWVLVGITLQFVTPTVWTAAVASRFVGGRGFAIAVVLAGTGVASSLNPIITSYLASFWGWRGGFIGTAMIWLVVVLPLCILFFFSASDKDRKSGSTGAQQQTLSGVHWRKAVFSSLFIRLALGALLTTIVILGFSINFAAMMTDAGMPAAQGAAMAGVMGITSIAGRLTTGLLLDRFSTRAPLIATLAFVLPAVACIIMMRFDGSILQSAVVACLIGIAVGADTDIAAYLTARYFGLRFFGTLFGTIIAILSIAIGLGPLLAAFIFDRTGSYMDFYRIGVVLSLSSAAIMFTLSLSNAGRGVNLASKSE